MTKRTQPAPCAPLTADQLDQLDPGIRAIVAKVREAGFETTDSGDGVSKPADSYADGSAWPHKHVAAALAPDRDLTAEAWRLQAVLGYPWQVEASYSTRGGASLVFAWIDADHVEPEPAVPPVRVCPVCGYAAHYSAGSGCQSGGYYCSCGCVSWPGYTGAAADR